MANGSSRQQTTGLDFEGSRVMDCKFKWLSDGTRQQKKSFFRSVRVEAE
jgi:hypothetical protein